MVDGVPFLDSLDEQQRAEEMEKENKRVSCASSWGMILLSKLTELLRFLSERSSVLPQTPHHQHDRFDPKRPVPRLWRL
jgi:hypothetical protein